MSLYLDGMFYKCSGVGRVFENLLSAILDDGRFGEIHTVVPATLRDAFVEQFPDPAVRTEFADYGPMSARDLLLKGRDLRPLRGKVPLFLFPGHNVPLFMPGRYVISVNDLTVFSPHFPLPWHRKAGFRWLLSRAVRGAEKVVTISETVKGDLIRGFSLPAAKICVIHPWIKEPFFRPAAGTGTASCSPCEGDYILYLGLRIAHKNLDGIVRAFLLVVEEGFPDLRLVIAGSRYQTPDLIDRWKEDPRLEGRLVEILNPTDEDVLNLFPRARAFVFPSFAEGFGLPPLEAMASGVPVVCSDIPVFREIYGDSVRYVDPALPESIAQGIRQVLSDRGYAEDLARKGRQRATLYRKERSVHGYLDLIRNLGTAGEAVSG